MQGKNHSYCFYNYYLIAVFFLKTAEELMSLDINIPQNIERTDELEEKAKKFVGLVNGFNKDSKKKALKYFNELNEVEQNYLLNHPQYNWRLQSARIQF